MFKVTLLATAVALSLAGCKGLTATPSAPISPDVKAACADVAQLAPLVPLVSAGLGAVPAAGPVLAAINTQIAAANKGLCMDPAALQALVTQAQAVVAQAKQAATGH